MKLEKASKRDKAWRKKKDGMRINGKSVFIIQQAIVNRANIIKVNKKEQEQK